MLSVLFFWVFFLFSPLFLGESNYWPASNKQKQLSGASESVSTQATCKGSWRGWKNHLSVRLIGKKGLSLLGCIKKKKKKLEPGTTEKVIWFDESCSKVV